MSRSRSSRNAAIRVSRIVALLAVLAVLPGCWDNKDINHRALPIVMGIAQKDTGFRISLFIPEFTRRQLRMNVVSGTGTTISEIVNRISTNLSNQVDLLHLKVILIEKGYAEAGMEESIASFMRSRDVSPKTMVAICDEDLDIFLNKLVKNSNGNGTLLYDFFSKEAGWNPQIVQTRVWQIYRSIHSYTRDIAIPIVKSGTDTVLVSAGSAIIKNGKMVDRIDEEEALIVNAFRGISTQGKIEIMEHATVLIVSNSVSKRGSMIDGKPVLRCTVRVKVSILETKGNVTMGMIKSELTEVLSKKFERLFRRVQKNEADIFGTGQYFRTSIPRDKLANWRSEYFPSMELRLRVHAIVQNGGNLKTPH